jgi:hypothetical protein
MVWGMWEFCMCPRAEADANARRAPRWRCSAAAVVQACRDR